MLTFKTDVATKGTTATVFDGLADFLERSNIQPSCHNPGGLAPRLAPLAEVGPDPLNSRHSAELHKWDGEPEATCPWILN